MAPFGRPPGGGHNAEIAKIVAVSPDGVLGRAALLGIDSSASRGLMRTSP
jgi:hypothetical protein